MPDVRAYVLRECTIDGEATELSMWTYWNRIAMSARRVTIVYDAPCSSPFLQNSQLPHESASHLIPTRSPSLTGEDSVFSPIATTIPTPCKKLLAWMSRVVQEDAPHGHLSAGASQR